MSTADVTGTRMSAPVELVDLRRGDPAAWRAVHGQVLRSAASFRFALAETWEDAVQEAEIRILHALRAGKVQDGSHLAAFTWHVTRNACIDEQRRREVRAARQLEQIPEPAASPMASPPAEAERVQHGGHIARLLHLMPDECRQLLWLLWKGTTYSELADRMGVSPGALRVRAYRCRRRARTRLVRMTSPVVGAAERLFRKHGYCGTTMADIAAASGTTMTELEGTFENKTAVLWAILYRMVAGNQGVSPAESDFVRPIRATNEPHRRIRCATRLTAGMYRRGLADMHRLVNDAARKDPRHEALVRRVANAQASVGLQIGRAILHGWAPPCGETVVSLSNAATRVVGPDNFLPRTHERGWTDDEFWEWAEAKVTEIFFR